MPGSGGADHLVGTELFGPIAPISASARGVEVRQRANATEFGLAGYVFTESLDRGLDVADALEAGLVGISEGLPLQCRRTHRGANSFRFGTKVALEG